VIDSMTRQERIESRHPQASRRSASPPCAGLKVEEVTALEDHRDHRIDHRDLALQNLVVEPGIGDLVFHLGDAGHHAHQPADAAHIRHLRQLLAHVGEVELALAHPLGGTRGLFRVDMSGGLFDQRHHVAHAEDPPRDAARMKNLPARRSFHRCRSA